MRLTTFTDYTLRTLIYLAIQPDRLVTIAKIAAAYDISANHMMKVVNQLALAGDIRTVRGQRGGLMLAREPEQINIGTVVRRCETSLAPACCFDGERCAIQEQCILKAALAQAVVAFIRVLDGYTLADVARNQTILSALLGIKGGDGVATVTHRTDRGVSEEVAEVCLLN
jgi:Rrf2 family nitric oxide-sensitive transcriptional repressor